MKKKKSYFADCSIKEVAILYQGNSKFTSVAKSAVF